MAEQRRVMRAVAKPLRLLSYLAPSIPEGLFELVASAIEAKTGAAVLLDFETSVSGPTPETDPFVSGRADVAFVCGPSYALLRAAGAPVDIIPAAAVFEDPRNAGRPVYFSDVIVAHDHPARSLTDLRGTTWTYNDRQSLSGWFRMLARLVELGFGAPESFFSRISASGAHVNSIALVSEGQATVSAVDSNALRFALRRNPSLDQRLRILESWGPSPVQPVLARSTLDPDVKVSMRKALLTLGQDPAYAPRLLEFGVRGFMSADEASYLEMREVVGTEKQGRDTNR
jgi:ABC-type phosphate/phosphonate transport system substrate-binding protein